MFFVGHSLATPESAVCSSFFVEMPGSPIAPENLIGALNPSLINSSAVGGRGTFGGLGVSQ
jgi:hypothetical protein